MIKKIISQEAWEMLPQEFLDRMKDMLGGEYEAFLHSLEEEKYSALRINPLKNGCRTDRQRTANRDDRQGEQGKQEQQEQNRDSQKFSVEWLAQYFNITHVSWEKNGFYYDIADQPGKHPLHEAGVYYIQEPSAMAVVPLLEAQPGEKILDLCAAPGGKSTQIAGYLQGKGLLVANEIHPARAKILSENMERLGVRNACVTNEEPTNLSEKFPEYFDRILVDAPCSGEGMFRKNELACEEWSPENVKLCAGRQDGILDCAARMLRQGGRLVYSTCTFAPAENEGAVSRFLARHPEFTLLPIDKAAMGLPEGKCDGRPEWADYVGTKRENEIDGLVGSGMTKDRVAQDVESWDPRHDQDLIHTLRLWPHVVQGEGHFAAVLQKKTDRTGCIDEENTIAAGSKVLTSEERFFHGSSAYYETMAQGGLEKGISPKDKDLEAWWDFWRETADADALAFQGKAADHSDDLTQLITEKRGIFLRFGENLYFAPENMPSLKGLKVLRPGLQLGTLKKNRFEPSHALALTLSPKDVRHVCHLSLQDEEQAKLASGYLNGQTFSMEGEKGWYLIAVDGYSLGWGKLAGGIMKNHYPKGLRK